jgi:gliding motility-associated-like protein
MYNLPIKYFLSILLIFNYVNSSAQSLISPNGLTSFPTNSFFSSSQGYCYNGSGLTSIPINVSAALSVTHNSPAVVAPLSLADAAYLSNGIYETSWNFSFSSPQNISGVALWLPCAIHGGGDAPFKKISIFNGVTLDTFELGFPSDLAKIIYFSTTYCNTTNITLNILETWHDLNTGSPNCGATGWGIYNSTSTLNSQYNVMLGEILFIKNDTLNHNILNLGNDTTLCSGDSLALDAFNIGATYLWNTGATTQMLNVTTSGTYDVRVTIGGCTYYDTVIVNFINCDTMIDTTRTCKTMVSFPNVFSPNNDGINDLFKPITYDCISNSELRIYNRWGNELYVTREVIDGWNGKSRDKDCVDGAYFWTLTHKSL